MSIILFGAGTIGRSVARGMKEHGVTDILFCDETPEKIGIVIDGVPVIGLQEGIDKHKGDRWIVTIMCVDSRPIIARLRYYGIVASAFLDFIRTPEADDYLFFPFGCLERPEVTFSQIDEVLQAVNLFDDKDSREVYLANLRFRCGAGADVLPHPNQDLISYLPDRFMGPDVTFVDGGAYNGDTIKTFVQYPYKRIIAFEPDRENFHKLIEKAQELDNAIYYPVALSNKEKKINFNAFGTASSYANPKGEVIVQGIALDNLRDNLAAPLYIKLDIEGAEMDALEGMKHIINDLHPLLAVCVYHHNSDLWKIPLYLREHYPFYKFELVPHAEYYDLVLYAIPEGWPK